MRIGLLTTYLALGDANDSGIGQHFRILADALAADGHTVHIIHPHSKPAPVRAALAALAPAWTWEVPDAHLPDWLIPPWHLSWSSHALLSHLWTAWIVDRHFRRSTVARSLEIIETHAYNIPAYFLARRRDRPRLVTRVSTTMSQITGISTVQARACRIEAMLERQGIRWSDELVTHTREHRDIVCNIEALDPARFHIVPHGVVDPGLPPLEHAPTGAEITFLFVGRFESRKGVDVLLAAIPEVTRAFPATRFVLAGDRGDGTYWEAFANAHPALAGNRVQSLGRVSAAQLTALYQRCDVFVAPSRYESFGLIYAEALSHGKPVIGCRAGGIPEVVQESVTGLLAEPGDVPTLVACLIALASDPARRRAMGCAARADFLARFSAAQLARASAALYCEFSPRNSVECI